MIDPTEPSTAPKAAKRPRAWVGWVAAGSLCVNLLLVGIIGGAVLRHGGPHPKPPAGIDPVSLMRVMRTLPEDRRDEALEILRDHRPKFEALRPARIAARLAIADALEADPMDGTALAAALNTARRSEAEGRAVIDDAFVQFVARLPRAARSKLAEEVREARRWGGRRRDGDGEHGHGGHWRQRD